MRDKNSGKSSNALLRRRRVSQVPALPNHKHERFAQEVAKGKTATEAYSLAGYSPNPTGSNAARMMGDDRISARVAELLDRGAQRAEVTVAWLLEQAQAIIKEARAAEDYAAASQTVERAAKIAGLWVDRGEIASTVRSVSADPMTPDQWQQQHDEAELPMN